MSCQFHREDGLPEAERPLTKAALQLLFQREKDGILLKGSSDKGD